MNYSDFPTKNKRRQQRRKMKQRSLHAQVLHEGRNGRYRHQVFNTNSIKRLNSNDLIKEWYADEAQEDRNGQRYKPKFSKEHDSKDSNTSSSGHGDCSGEVVESSDEKD